MRVQQDRDKHDHIAQQNRQQRLFPTHAGADQPGRQHISRDAVGHGNPQSREIVRAPGSLFLSRRREIVVVKLPRWSLHWGTTLNESGANKGGFRWKCTGVRLTAMQRQTTSASTREYALAVAIVAVCAAVSLLLRPFLAATNLVMIYFVGVLIVATRC